MTKEEHISMLGDVKMQENMEIAKAGDPITEKNAALHPDHEIRKPKTRFSEGQAIKHADGASGKIISIHNDGYIATKVHTASVTDDDISEA